MELVVHISFAVAFLLRGNFFFFFLAAEINIKSIRQCQMCTYVSSKLVKYNSITLRCLFKLLFAVNLCFHPILIRKPTQKEGKLFCFFTFTGSNTVIKGGSYASSFQQTFYSIAFNFFVVAENELI